MSELPSRATATQLMSEHMDTIIKARIKAIMEQREEVMSAFIAKYGFEPDRFVQIHQMNVIDEDGRGGRPGLCDRWFVRRRTDEEMAQLSAMGSQL